MDPRANTCWLGFAICLFGCASSCALTEAAEPLQTQPIVFGGVEFPDATNAKYKFEASANLKMPTEEVFSKLVKTKFEPDSLRKGLSIEFDHSMSQNGSNALGVGSVCRVTQGNALEVQTVAVMEPPYLLVCRVDHWQENLSKIHIVIVLELKPVRSGETKLTVTQFVSHDTKPAFDFLARWTIQRDLNKKLRGIEKAALSQPSKLEGWSSAALPAIESTK